MPRQWIRPYHGSQGPLSVTTPQAADRAFAGLGMQSLSSAPSLQGLSQLPATADALTHRSAHISAHAGQCLVPVSLSTGCCSCSMVPTVHGKNVAGS